MREMAETTRLPAVVVVGPLLDHFKSHYVTLFSRVILAVAYKMFTAIKKHRQIFVKI